MHVCHWGFFATWAADASNFTGRVTAASVPFHDICGSLPALAGGIAGVVACTGLRELDLAFNGFTGPLASH
jgi:hypothetical protein